MKVHRYGFIPPESHDYPYFSGPCLHMIMRSRQVSSLYFIWDPIDKFEHKSGNFILFKLILYAYWCISSTYVIWCIFHSMELVNMLLDTQRVSKWCEVWVFICTYILDSCRSIQINVTWCISPLYANLVHWYMLLTKLYEKACLSSFFFIYYNAPYCLYSFIFFIVYMLMKCIGYEIWLSFVKTSLLLR